MSTQAIEVVRPEIVADVEIRDYHTGRFAARWQQDSITKLANFWNVSLYSASQCAAEFGVSRSAIIGAIHRHRPGRFDITFKMRPQGFRGNAAAKRAPRASKESRGLMQKIQATQRQQAALVATEAVDIRTVLCIPISQRRFIEQLTLNTCRWPIGEDGNQFYCGGETFDRVYCPGHNKLGHAGFGKKFRAPHPFWR